jgi:hypothetical protein
MKLKVYVVAMQAKSCSGKWMWMLETFLDEPTADIRHSQDKQSIKTWKGEFRRALKPQLVEIEVPR